MPELPEVETVARNLREKLQGKSIQSVLLCRSSVMKCRPDFLQARLPGFKVAGVCRRGKYLGFENPEGERLWFHLGMTGQLLWAENWQPEDRHLHLVLSFAGVKTFLTFRDIRRFGKVFYSAKEGALLPTGFRALGAEPLEISRENFVELFKTRSGLIKALLLNQSLTAGIGNIYADESLFRAGIHPKRRASKLSREALGRLHESVQSILGQAIEMGGSTIDDFLHADGLEGNFQKLHRVYGKSKKPCFVCGTVIKRIVVAGRSTFFCSQCQK